MIMATMAVKKVNASLREEWLNTVKELQYQIETWVSEEQGWSTEWGKDHQVEEAPLGIYTVTSMNVYTPDGRLVLEPIARNYPGRGIVELYAWPTAYRIRLVQHPNTGWRVLTDSGIYLRQPWDQQHFALLVRELLAADDMIPLG